jgi:3-deoxy-D-manno-octulosonic-acid transferase
VAETDAEAQRLYETMGSYLSLAIANQVTVLNPSVLVLVETELWPNLIH